MFDGFNGRIALKWLPLGLLVVVAGIVGLGISGGQPVQQIVMRSQRAPEPRTLFVLNTHVNFTRVHDEFKKMERDLGRENVFMLMDDTVLPGASGHLHRLAAGRVKYGSNSKILKEENKTQMSNIENSNILLVNKQEMEAFDPYYNHGGNSGPARLALLYHYLAQEPFDYLWLIEFDVLCNGNYKRCYEPTHHMQEDFVSAQVERFHWQNWHHWRRIVGKLSRLPLEQRWKTFFPVTRYSKRFLKVIANDIGQSSGYCEVYVPTLCASAAMSLAAFPDSMRGNFGYRPTRMAVPIEFDDKLYHPVKY